MNKSWVLAILLPGPALADCAEDTFVSCTIKGKPLDVCVQGDRVTYAYGRAGARELELSEPLSALTLQPWSGVGRSIWEGLSFRNAGYTYEAYLSFDRLNPDGAMEGGVSVLKGDDLVAQLAWPELIIVGALWLITFPAAMAGLAMTFASRRKQEQP